MVCSNTCRSPPTSATSYPSPSGRSAWVSLPTTCSGVWLFLVVIVGQACAPAQRLVGKTLTQPGPTSRGQVTSARTVVHQISPRFLRLRRHMISSVPAVRFGGRVAATASDPSASVGRVRADARPVPAARIRRIPARSRWPDGGPPSGRARRGRRERSSTSPHEAEDANRSGTTSNSEGRGTSAGQDDRDFACGVGPSTRSPLARAKR